MGEKRKSYSIGLLLTVVLVIALATSFLSACSGSQSSSGSSVSSGTDGSNTEQPSQEEAPAADKSNLDNLVAECESLDSAIYTKNTFSKLENALNNAKTVSATSGLTQEQIDLAYNKLATAYNGLKQNLDGYKTVSFKKIARNPDNYEGKHLKFSGKVLQVVEGDEENQIRLATDGEYDDVIMVGYDPSLTKSRVLEDDAITVYGTCVGLYSYESTFGEAITLPALVADQIVIKD